MTLLLTSNSGDPRGVGLVADICEPERRDKSGHFLVPQTTVSNLAPEDLNHLRLKGAFALPAVSVRDSLIRTYFHYVHPFLPIIEVNTFLTRYGTSARQELSILLLWSMFLAAANV
jgi:hypothetical protein